MGFLAVKFLTTLSFLGFRTVGWDWVPVPPIRITIGNRVVIIGVNIVKP